MKQNWIVANAKDMEFLFENYGDLSLLAGMLKLPWVNWIDKFGLNGHIDAWDVINDIWQYGWEYTYTVNAWATYYFSSSDTNDTQSIMFSVLTVDSNGNWNKEEFEQSIAWQTKTQLNPPSGHPVVRIFRLENEANDGGDLNGTLYVYEDDTVTNWVPQTPEKIRIIMDDWYNQTQHLLYTVPTGYVWFLLRWEAWVGKWSWTDQVRLEYRSRRYWKVFKTKKSFTLMTGWSSIYRDVRSVKDPLPAKTDILLRSTYASWNNMEVWGSIDILLVDERMLEDTYLSAIWQVKRVGDYPAPILNIW